MRKLKPRRARLEEVRVSTNGEYAVIDFVDSRISGVHLHLGPRVRDMTLQEILDAFNETMDAMEAARESHAWVAVEVPMGSPQIDYDHLSDQWTPRGGVLRCIVNDGGPGGEATIYIDEHELSLGEFGRLLCTYAGWGMRICFVPDDEVHLEPVVEVREPEE